MSVPIRIAVGDDQPLFRRGAASALCEGPGLEVVAETAGGEAALSAILDLEPDIAVLDGAGSGTQRTRVLREVCRKRSRTRVLVLTPPNDLETIQAALSSGVRGYLPRDSSEAEIRGAVAIIARGGTVLSEELRTSLFEAVVEGAEAGGKTLSDQERKILSWIAQGRCARRIGEELHLSESTIKTHLRRTYEKLGVRNQASAVAEGMRRNLIS